MRRLAVGALAVLAAGKVTRPTGTPVQPPGASDERVPLALSPDGRRVLITGLDRAEVLPIAGGRQRRVCGAGESMTIESGAWLR